MYWCCWCDDGGKARKKKDLFISAWYCREKERDEVNVHEHASLQIPVIVCRRGHSQGRVIL